MTTISNRLTILDWIGIVYTVINIIGIFFFSIAAARLGDSFEMMGVNLSMVTILTTNPWFLIVAGIISTIIFSLIWHKDISTNLTRKRLVIVVAFVITSSAIVLCFVGIFLPLLKLASPVT
jgi:hypothetical protein